MYGTKKLLTKTNFRLPCPFESQAGKTDKINSFCDALGSRLRGLKITYEIKPSPLSETHYVHIFSGSWYTIRVSEHLNDFEQNDYSLEVLYPRKEDIEYIINFITPPAR